MNQNQDKAYPVIKCPHCQYGYAPAEVLHPHDFMGKPTSVLRDALGKVLYQEYAELGLTQSRTFAVDSNKSVMHTYWTQKGRLFLYDLLKGEGILPLIEREG